MASVILISPAQPNKTDASVSKMCILFNLLRSVPAGRVACILLVGSLIIGPSCVAAEELRFEVIEDAGIARFSYPIRVKLKPKKPVAPEANFRLLGGHEPVTAQIRRDQTSGSSNHWWLDFNISLLPYESKQFTLQYGADVPTGPQRSKGHVLTQREDTFEVSNAPYITWTVPHDLTGLLRSVAFPPNDHLRSASPGLLYVDRNGNSHRIGGDSWQVTPQVVSHGREGVALRFEVASEQPELREVSAVVDLYFPVTKSWVEVDWQVTDPHGNVSAIGAELNLNVDAPTPQAPTLVDFGATSLVYAALRAGQWAELRAGSSAGPASEYAWQVFRGRGEKREPLVFGSRQTAAQAPPEGWAHVMDRHSCLALALHEFSQHGEDLIQLAAEGRVRIQRTFRNQREQGEASPKRLRFWMHFVYFPPHRSAATSPQAMQNPLVVRWQDP